MNFRIRYYGWMLVSVCCWTSCSKEAEALGDDYVLPKGLFPVEFADVASGKSSGMESRVSEDPSGIHSFWTEGDQVRLRITGGENDAATIATISDNGQLSHPPLYWRTTKDSQVTAWYPAENGSISLLDQNRQLVYILKTNPTECNYLSGPIHLEFNHQLAKVRIVVTGGFSWLRSSKLAIWGYASCEAKDGTFSAGKNEDYIEMRDIRSKERIFEAQVYPRSYKKGEAALRISFWRYSKFFKLGKDVDLTAGCLYTLKLDARVFE